MIKAKLIVVGGDAKQTEVDLKNLPMTIGRASDASITLPHALVSRKHCELFEQDDKLFVKDLNSLNGTYVNSEKINGSCPIQPGQLLTLGNVTFRADIENITSPIPVPAENKLVEQSGNGNKPSLIEEQDTDESLVQPSQFAFEAEQVPSGSISFGAIENLPQASPHASFNEQIEIEGQNRKATADESDPIRIDLGKGDAQESEPSGSSLDEFFRKMPK